MAKENRLRCPSCGMCYEGKATAESLRALVCTSCGANTTLVEEDPVGVFSGALPPLQRILALTVALFFCIFAYIDSFFAILCFAVLVFLTIEIHIGHKNQRHDRIILWDKLRDTFTSLTEANAKISDDLSQSRKCFVESTVRSNQYGQLKEDYDAITASNSDILKDLAQTRKQLEEATFRLSQYDSLKESYAALRASNSDIQEKLSQTCKQLEEVTCRFDQIAPERREQLAAEITTQRKTLGLLDDLGSMALKKDELKESIKELKKRIVSFEEEELLQSFGFYKPLYDCADSAAYSQLLEQVRSRQKEMVKDKGALRTLSVFSVDSDKASGKKIVKNLEKLVLKAFNGECDATIDKVTFSNLEAIAARISKAYQDLNELCQCVGISITQSYLNSKLEELNVCYEYQMKIKAEREEQRKIREQMREQARLIKEIEDARKKIEKEETHFNQIIAELQARMEAAAASEKEKYESKLREYQAQLAVVQKDKEEVVYREQSTRAGYVYIISNIGSFGEDLYKIGVTRRLDPQERVDELGDASVPFDFDVHAMIFSDDAPSLEGALHAHFASRTINKVNPRKEFFRVRLDEIEEVVKTHHNKVVEFTKLAKAEDYRLTMAKLRSIEQSTTSQRIA